MDTIQTMQIFIKAPSVGILWLYIETIKTYGGTLWLFNIAMEAMAHRNR
jgi:hypothetical protein